MCFYHMPTNFEFNAFRGDENLVTLKDNHHTNNINTILIECFMFLASHSAYQHSDRYSLTLGNTTHWKSLPKDFLQMLSVAMPLI